MEINNSQKYLLNDNKKNIINNYEKKKNEEDNNTNIQMTTDAPLKQEIPEIIENEEEEINYD